MRIAFFNWRDIRHPSAGGAEVVMDQLLCRLAKRGHQVTLFTASYPGSAKQETIKGVEHVHYGGCYSIYLKTHSIYKKRIKGKYDIIVESINGFPFFTSLFAREKVVPLIYQLTKENWYSGLPMPLAFACYHTEELMLSYYRDLPAITISESTKKDLEPLGFRNVSVLQLGTDINPPMKMKILPLILLCFLPFAPAGFSADHQLVDRVAAVVNNEVITQSEFDLIFVPIYEQIRPYFQRKPLEV